MTKRGIITVYTPDGRAIDKEAVDARECVEHLGYTLTPPEPKVEEIIANDVVEVAIDPTPEAPVVEQEAKPKKR